MALAAARFARRPASPDKTFGWYRAAIIGALVNGAFLLVMAVVVIVMGAMRLSEPPHLATTPMLLVAAGGLVTEIISIILLYRQQGTDLNIRGAFWHVIQTFVGSLIIIVAALVIRFTGFLAIDPLLGMGFGLVLLWASYGIMRDAVHLLMEGTPPGGRVAAVVQALEAIDGVENVHHAHAWALTSNRQVFSAHIRTSEPAAARAAKVLAAAHRVVTETFGFFFSTVQVETECLDEARSTGIDVGRLSSGQPHASSHHGAGK